MSVEFQPSSVPKPPAPTTPGAQAQKTDFPLGQTTKNPLIRFCNALGIKSRRRPADDAQENAAEILTSLDPRYRFRLLSMYRGESQPGTDGRSHPIDKRTRIPPSQGMWLYNFCTSVKPQALLEIGMAYGYSTLYFLAAIAKNQRGHHTAIDPYQRTQWQGIGLAHTQALVPTKGPDSPFQFIEDRSDRAATDLIRSNSTFEVIYIDGNHRFDDVLVDFYLFAPLCTVGGHLIFDDMWMSSVQTVVAYIRANRKDFVKVHTGESNLAVFRKVGNDVRKWTNFRKFPVSCDTG